MLELRDAEDDEVLGTIDLVGDTLTVTGAGGEIVEAWRRRGLNDRDILRQLDGWSNGYLYLHRRPGPGTVKA